jgi:hypothetical protein
MLMFLVTARLAVFDRFVKYVSASAPGSRWDIAVEYEISEPAAEEDSGSDSAEEDDEDA